MKGEASYQIYNASAGSGKTFTIAKNYLCLLLKDQRPLAFKEILGITFTNKAVGEMKKRILVSLLNFAQKPSQSKDLFEQVRDQLGISSEELQANARFRLKELLHNYSFFDISTIDKFNHRLIKTFARDLKLPSQFKVILEEDLFLQEAIDGLYSKLNDDIELKRAVVDYAIEKISSNTSWDISYNLIETAKMLFNETQRNSLKTLIEKSPEDLKKLHTVLKERLTQMEEGVVEAANEQLELMQQHQIQDYFSGKYYPKFLAKLSTKDFTVSTDTAWIQNFEVKDLYPQKCPTNIKELMDELKPQFVLGMQLLRKGLNEYFFRENAYKNFLPLSLLYAVQKQMKEMMDKNETLPISEFNKIIYDVVKNEPVPFIYERLGERYRHFFVDEFQDTSNLQWKNLVPLIGNSLSTEIGSAMLVGDPKQAIYRWRGGSAQQFVNLYHQIEDPFTIPANQQSLDTNFRSTKTVVEFNNDFFSFSSLQLPKEDLVELYQSSCIQEIKSNEEGYVQLDFLPDELKEDMDASYCAATEKIIAQVRAKGYGYGDICVLTRNNDQSVQMAKHLTQAEIPIISSQSLLLSSSPEVNFLIDLLFVSQLPLDQIYWARILEFLYQQDSSKIKKGFYRLNECLQEDFGFSISKFSSLEVYDAVCYAIQCFELGKSSSAYINYFLDELHEYFQKEKLGLSGFLEQWELHKDKWSVKSPDAIEAVQLYTIHKSKGLEFPIVIYPFADSKIIDSRNDHKIWVPVDSEEHAGYHQLLFSKNSKLEQYSELTAQLVLEEDAQLALDSFNVLYVALTRAVKGLYILTRMEVTATGDFVQGKVSTLFADFLKHQGKWNSDQSRYSYGKLPMQREMQLESDLLSFSFRYSNKVAVGYPLLSHEKLHLDDQSYQAKQAGTAWHYFMEQIKSIEDLDYAAIKMQETYPFEQVGTYRSKAVLLFEHPQLKSYFQSGVKVKNEQAMYTEKGEEFRADRLVFFDQQVVIIDYKTGVESDSHTNQINAYAQVLEQMGYSIKEKLIVYVHDTINVVKA